MTEAKASPQQNETEVEIPKYFVRDGVRTLEFFGYKLAESSSRVYGKPRWVEFRLYKTPKGTYILSRTGVSIYYHSTSCSIVTRNRLSAVDGAELIPGYVACPDCKPNLFNDEGVYPETPRFWAQSSDKATGVIGSLMKYDDNGTEYLTNVARRLLEDASVLDPNLKAAFENDFIE